MKKIKIKDTRKDPMGDTKLHKSRQVPGEPKKLVLKNEMPAIGNAIKLVLKEEDSMNGKVMGPFIMRSFKYYVKVHCFSVGCPILYPFAFNTLPNIS